MQKNKFFHAMMIAISTIFLLSACGNADDKSKEQSSDLPTAEALYAKAEGAIKGYTSMSSTIAFNQKTETSDSSQTVKLEMTKEPNPAAQLNLTEGNSNFEIMLVDEKSFVNSGDKWAELTGSGSEQANNQVNSFLEKSDVSKQLGVIEPYLKDAKVTSKDGEYVITLKETNNEALFAELEQQIADQSLTSASVLTGTDITDVEYMISLDKESSVVTDFTINISAKVPGTESEVSQAVIVKDIKFNHVAEIKAPAIE